MDEKAKENWGSGGPYEQYVGRWSRKIAKEFLAWLGVSPGHAWSDVGCGTGALVDVILAECEPQSIAAIDRSEGFIAEARCRITDSRLRFEVGDATAPMAERIL
jgi:ubiquinone/menaquinone biosynthesis C-methylase UbiE